MSSDELLLLLKPSAAFVISDEISLCNLALARIGVTERIKSFDEGSTVADLCQMTYNTVRDHLLAAHEWNFATKTITPTLAKDESQSYETHPLWPYIYEYPSDCIRILRLVHANEASGMGCEFRVFISAITGKQRIGATEEDLFLEYIVQITDMDLYPGDFKNALAWWLAVDLSTALSRNAALAQNAVKMFQYVFSQAILHDAREGYLKPPVSNRYKGVRN